MSTGMLRCLLRLYRVWQVALGVARCIVGCALHLRFRVAGHPLPCVEQGAGAESDFMTQADTRISICMHIDR
jgi:hypothetical protein